ncbi:MAG: ribulose-phosphate 3-epimerase, partial [bacterium]
LNPDTKVEAIEPYREIVDFVVVMTVQPGFGGQSFRTDQCEKIETLSEWGIPVEVDGGINQESINVAREAGADWFVAGSAVFGEEDISEAISRLT